MLDSAKAGTNNNNKNMTNFAKATEFRNFKGSPLGTHQCLLVKLGLICKQSGTITFNSNLTETTKWYGRHEVSEQRSAHCRSTPLGECPRTSIGQ
jgi:hypothetical protein